MSSTHAPLRGVPRADPVRERLADALAALGRAQASVWAADEADVLDTACRVAAELFGADCAVLAVRDGDDAIARAMVGVPFGVVGHRVPLHGTVTGRAILTGRTQLCEDAAYDDRSDAEVGRRHSLRSSVVAPLDRGGTTVGALLVGSRRPRAFDQADAELVRLFAEATSHRLTLALHLALRADMDEALADHERLLRTVVGSLDEGVTVHGECGAFVLGNDAAARILGTTTDELVGRHSSDSAWRTVRPDGSDWPYEEHPVTVALATGDQQRGTMGVRRSDGRLRWLSITATPTGAVVDGERRACVASFSDITEQLEASRERALQQGRLRAAQQLTGLASWDYDLVSGEHRWSERSYELVGRDPAEGPPGFEGFLAYVHPDDREACRRHAAEAVPGVGRTNVFRVVRPDGEVRTLQAWDELEARADGTPSRLHGTTLDVTDREAVARELADTRDRLADAQELTGLAWWDWDVATGRLSWSDGMYRLAGVPLGTVVTIDDWHAQLHPEDRTTCAGLEGGAIEDGVGYRHVFRVRRGDGELRWLQSWTESVPSPDGQVVRLRGTTLDVTAQEAAVRGLAASEEQFRVAFDGAPIGMVMLALDDPRRGRVLRANDAVCRMLGYTKEEYLRLTLADWTCPEDLDRDRERLQGLYDGDRESISYEKRYRHRDGHVVPAWVTTAVLKDAHGAPLYLVSHILDVTERQAQQAELQRLVHTDTLTGLANRTLLDHRLPVALGRLAARPGDGSGGPVAALLLLDLDRFKLLNDSLGHQAGDALLVEVGRRLRAVTREEDTVARLGGDEFVVLVERASGEAEVQAVADRVLEVLRVPFSLPSGETLSPTASLGIATATGPGRTPEELLREADLALYRAKDDGRDRLAVFDDDLRSRAVERLSTEHRLRDALRDGRLHLLVQPVVDLATGSVVAGEALVRLRDRDGSLLPPAAFIDVAEESGLVVELDAWVLDAAVAALAAGAYVPDGSGERHRLERLAVNVAGRTLSQPGFVERVRRALDRHGVPGSRLHVELTERTVLDVGPAVTGALAGLSALGIEVGLDDFGTGYSALAYLQRFELDFLKIDRSFVARLGTSPQADAVVAAVVDLAHANGLAVTAEGVEEPEQARLLRAMGCDLAQGWLFGRPAELLDVPVRSYH